jgi:hypothetical protein
VLDWALQRDIPSPVISDSQQALMTYRDLDLRGEGRWQS